MFLKTYLAIGALVVGLYSVTALAGIEFGRTALKKPPLRQPYAGRGSKGSSYYGSSGYRGGK